MKILSSFTHPQVVPNLNECVCSAEHKGRYSEECGKLSSSGAPLTSIVFFFLLWKSMVPQNSLITNFLPLCSAEQRNSFRFGSTWGWVNDRIFIFGWTIPLTVQIFMNISQFKAKLAKSTMGQNKLFAYNKSISTVTCKRNGYSIICKIFKKIQ